MAVCTAGARLPAGNLRDPHEKSYHVRALPRNSVWGFAFSRGLPPTLPLLGRHGHLMLRPVRCRALAAYSSGAPLAHQSGQFAPMYVCGMI